MVRFIRSGVRLKESVSLIKLSDSIAHQDTEYLDRMTFVILLESL